MADVGYGGRCYLSRRRPIWGGLLCMSCHLQADAAQRGREISKRRFFLEEQRQDIHVLGGLAEEAMKPAPMSIADVVADEDNLRQRVVPMRF